ncbi:MAG TPA: phosphotransferase [Fimbriimonas sp.]
MDRLLALCDAVRSWQPGAAIRRSWPLKGGMSAEMYALELDGGRGGFDRIVVRYPGPEVGEIFEDPAGQEFRTLQAVKAAGLPSPIPVAVLDSSEGRFLLMEFLDGECTASSPEPLDTACRYAEALAEIHRADLARTDFSFLLRKSTTFTPKDRPLSTELREAEVVEALMRLGDPEESETVLMHGDFWPGNVLWTDGKVSGIVDWENALLGPALADLGMTRLDMYWAFGREAMEAFTRRYLELNPQPTESLVYWDLRAALRPMPNLFEWSDPYVALGRADVTGESMASVLLSFIDDALRRA